MIQTVLLTALFFASTAWADEPDLSRLKMRVQETISRLDLTEEQIRQLKPVLADHFNAQTAVLDKYGFNSANRDDRPDAQTLHALRREFDDNKNMTSKRLSGILSKEQLAEFEKIQKVQKKQIREKFLSKRAEDIGAKLGLTEEQIRQLKPVLADHLNAQMAVLDKHGIAIGNRGDRKRLRFRKLRALRKDLDRIRDRTSKHLSDILSKKQLVEFERIQKEQRQRMREQFRSGAQG